MNTNDNNYDVAGKINDDEGVTEAIRTKIIWMVWIN